MEFEHDGRRKKWTPQITFCAGPGGECRWCIVPFPKPRPLYGLYELIARPQEPVIVVEGEKACDAGRLLLPAYVVVTWPGGSKGIAHVGWSPLAGRDVFLLPDADTPGRDAMDGWSKGGERVPGIAELLAAVAERVRVVDPPRHLPDGWDLADANDWSQTEAARWLMANLRPGGVATAAAEPIGEPPPSSRTRTGAPPVLNRRRLEGLVRKIIFAGEAQLEGTLRWASRLVGDAARKGEIELDVAEAVLVRAAARAGLEVIEARRTVANIFHSVNCGGTE